MQALILAGGKGTRLRPLTVYTPKPIVPVMNRPFLLYQIDILGRAGITDITLSLSYQPDKIEDLLGDGSDLGVSLNYITEPNPLGTGGAYRFASRELNETTVVLNGDILTDVDISKVIGFHRKNSADATLTLASVDDPSRFGLVETADDGRILRFIEKPKPEDAASDGINTINAGIYVLEPRILDLVPEGEHLSFEYDIFPEILRRGMAFYGYNLGDSYWRDLGNPKSYLEAHHDFVDGKIKGFDLDHSREGDVATAAAVDEVSVIGPGAVIKPGARIKRSAIGPGVHIDEKAVVEGSVIWPHARISAGAEIRDAIIGRSGYIGRNVIVGAGTVLGDKAAVPDYSKV
ncbi:MAG: sugar phosphate nucleotidyltransferase [Pyrinomonadaceae bacterium]